MAIRGERMGIEYLVNTYKDLAYTVAIKIVSNKEDAEEVVQDSFMKAFAALRKLEKSFQILHVALPHRLQHSIDKKRS